MAFAFLLVVSVSIGALLSIAAHCSFRAAGRLFIVTGSIAAVAAYTFIGAVNQGIPWFVAEAVALLCGWLLGMLLGWLAGRMSGEAFLLIGLALAEVTRRLLYHFDAVTSGAYGLRLLTPAPLGTGAVASLAATIVLFLASGLAWFFRTPLGCEWLVSGASSRAASLLGSNPQRVALWAVGLSALAAAQAGILHAVAFQYVHPDDLALGLGVAALAVGVAAPPRHVVAGVAILSFAAFGLREVLRLVDTAGPARFAVYQIVAGIVLIGMALRTAANEVG